jgi:hypothetical protein
MAGRLVIREFGHISKDWTEVSIFQDIAQKLATETEKNHADL